MNLISKIVLIVLIGFQSFALFMSERRNDQYRSMVKDAIKAAEQWKEASERWERVANKCIEALPENAKGSK